MSNSKIDLILKQLLELNAKISNLEKENTYLKAQLGVKTSEKQVKKGLNKIASEYKSKPGTGAESINIKFKKKPDPNTFKGYKLIEHYFKTGEQK
jgi:outer membrane murein-binding lipoprotein Lpp